MPLSSEHRARYARQMILPEVGEHGQLRLAEARVALIGAGGLGSPVALYLASAGVGHLTLIDPDHVESSNLHRQLLHTPADLTRPKVQSAADTLRALRPDLSLRLEPTSLTATNARDLLRGHDLVIDGSDNFPARFAANDGAFFEKIPLLHAAIFQWSGQLTLFAPHLGTPCYRCLLPQPPAPGLVPSCAEAGVLGALVGLIGSWQATEALKFLLGMEELALHRLLEFEVKRGTLRSFAIQKDPTCHLCSEQATLQEPEPTATPATCSMSDFTELSPDDFRQQLTETAEILLIDVRESEEHALGALPNSRNLPLSQWPTLIEELPTDQAIFLYCQHGMRSAKAAHFLVSRGYQRVSHLQGGYAGWEKS